MQAHSRKQIYNINKLQKRLRRNVGQAIEAFNMIEDGDRIMVCLSGGADSYTMLELLLNLRRNAPVDFELAAVNLDQKQPGFPEQVLPNYLTDLGVPFHIVEQDTYSIVKNIIPDNKTMCGLCSRLRRGILYSFAREHGFTKIALGHHRDDMIETLFLNMFYGGKLKAMPPKLLSDDGAHIVIRPLAYCKESDIKTYAEHKAFPIIPCQLCGSQDHLQRQTMKKMLGEWENKYPGRMETIFSAMQNLVPSHLADTKMFAFPDMKSKQETVADGKAASWLHDNQ